MTHRRRPSRDILVRQAAEADLPGIMRISDQIYPDMPWEREQFERHQAIFPDGQLVAIDRSASSRDADAQRVRQPPDGKVVGMAASLIISWDEYEIMGDWDDFTADGYFTNHDPEGRTLYGAEVMVDPQEQGKGVGKKLYAARRDLCRRLRLRRIRAGARIPGYHEYADLMSAEQYVIKVVNGELGDPTLSFQLKQGFRVVAVVRNYMPDDTETGGYAVVIEWINHRVAQKRDYRSRDPRFAVKRPTRRDRG